MTQPEALRLADAIDPRNEDELFWRDREAAAAELRRLQAENEALRKTLAASCNEERQQMWEASPGGGCSRALSAEFQRDALLEALKQIEPILARMYGPQAAELPPMQIVRAAIAKAEENT